MNFKLEDFEDIPDLDLFDDVEKKEREDKQKLMHQRRVKELMRVIENSNSSHIFKEERDPYVIMEVSRLVFDDMIDNNHKRAQELREKII